MPPILRVGIILILRVSFSPKLLSILAVEIAQMTTVSDDNMVNDYIFSAITVQWILRKLNVILAIVICNIADFDDCIHSE